MLNKEKEKSASVQIKKYEDINRMWNTKDKMVPGIVEALYLKHLQIIQKKTLSWDLPRNSKAVTELKSMVIPIPPIWDWFRRNGEIKKCNL